MLPDNIGQEFMYGRVVTAGELAETAQDDELIAFDSMGMRPLELDPHKQSELVIITDEMVFCAIAPTVLQEAGLPIP